MNLDDDDTVDELPAAPRKMIPEADRELLELAARALGAVRVEDVDGEEWLILHFADGTEVHGWNSLLFSGDAFELQVKLDLCVSQWPRHTPPDVMVGYRKGENDGANLTEEYGTDPVAATRRAVTRAAAEIGKQRS
jgi:hypothetical protein